MVFYDSLSIKKIINSAYGLNGVLLTGSFPISAGDVIVFTSYGDSNQGALLTEVPYL